ncbi:Putative oligopeptide ABC transporter, ATP-binding protein [Mycobacteroides abscessus subsp. abscessus]|nr:Putative oligopeptide ABC transporter, ATP-binding protein [Mycobacteroides abscessus subsp. abscessus]
MTFSTDSGPVSAVDDVSFDVEPGEVLAVVGESGSGKSVSSRTAIRLLPDTARVTGSVLLDGRDVTKLSGSELAAMRGKDIAMVFQEPGAALDPLFTIGYQVAEAVRAHSDMTRAQARARVIELLKLVRLPDPERRYDCYPHQLSGGQKQRVVIAMAIACDPKVNPRAAARPAGQDRQRHRVDHPQHGCGCRHSGPCGRHETGQGR